MIRAGYSQAHQWDWEDDSHVASTTRRVKRTTHRKVKTGKLWLFKGGLCLFVYGLILVFLCLKSSTLGYDIVQLQSEVNSLETGNKRIEYELARMRNLENVERTAMQELGMYKPEQHLAVAAVQAAPEAAAVSGPVAIQSQGGQEPLEKIYAGLVQLAEHN